MPNSISSIFKIIKEGNLPSILSGGVEILPETDLHMESVGLILVLPKGQFHLAYFNTDSSSAVRILVKISQPHSW